MSSSVAALGRRMVRVLIADDSAVMRRLLRMVFDTTPAVEVVAAVASGTEALGEFSRVNPDLVLLDIEMPGMNGLEVLSAIRGQNRRVPIIMCSTLTWRGAQITIEALSRGATDYVTKPAAQKGVREAVSALAGELIPKVLAFFPSGSPPLPRPRTVVAGVISPAAGPPPRIVVIGVSTGGPAALEVLLPKMPASFPVPILIVQHMPHLFTGLLAERLNSLCALRVREAVEGARIEPGVVEIARGDWHLELSRDFRMHLNQNEPENFCRPSVDVLFRSAASITSGRLLGVVLTGMGSDGLAGCRAIRQAGGTIFVQDAASSVIWGMPGAVANAGLAHKTLPLEDIAREMMQVVPREPARLVVSEAAL